METELIDAGAPDFERRGLIRAAELLRGGGLVAIPTETVYGLAANALDARAVEKIFLAKGRPQDNPLIVHVADRSWLDDYALEVPPAARRLMDIFWPGPLTIILRKSQVIPGVVSAGLDTAAFRCPSHPVAHAVIATAGVPLAAPSANISGRPSPTLASHVMGDLGGRIDAVVDGGECAVGLESTVVTLCTPVPTLLRPGGVTPRELKEALGQLRIHPAVTQMLGAGEKAASPGMKYKHYSPKTKVIIVKGSLEKTAEFVNSRPGRAAVMCFDGEREVFRVPCVEYGALADSASQARRLFETLRDIDSLGVDVVYARCPQESGVGLAVYNRLLRAAGFEIIEL
jgi:L-threonylcarbamoyladenylate synthase